MSRPRICYTREHNSLNAYYLQDFVNKYFEICPLNNWLSSLGLDAVLYGIPWRFESIKRPVEAGIPIIVDNLQEFELPDLQELKSYRDNVLILTAGSIQEHPDFRVQNVEEWFWYFESLWYISRGYDQYRSNRHHDALRFFMPVRRQSPERDLVIEKMGSLLDQAIWSYMQSGRSLPEIPDEHAEDQRWFNPGWYDSTCFSVVVESEVDHASSLRWSEKSCKPLAFQHPFLSIAQPGLLSKLREKGFETYPELFDESYDSITEFGARLDHIIQQIKDFDPGQLDTYSVKQKITHNHDLFFDKTKIYHGITEKVINPILEFLSQKH